MQRLAKAITFLRIDDWNNETVDTFLHDLKAFKTTIDDLDCQKHTDADITASYEIIFTDANGIRIPRHFNKSEYSDRARLLFNEITTAIEEMGQSINEQEKRQVLIDVLEGLCK